MKNTAAFIIALIVIASTASAVTQLSHEVVIEIDNSGNAKVTERFVLGLSDGEKNIFDTITRKNVNNLADWQGLYPDINQYVLGNTTSPQISTSKIGGGQFGSEVKLEYSVSGFAERYDTVGRYDYFRITGDDLKFYNQKANYLNLGPADMSIFLPDIVKETDVITAMPKPWIASGNNLRWISGTASNNFTVEYKREIAIGESLDINRLIDSYFVKRPLYGGVIIIFLIFSVIYRRQIISLFAESFASEGEIRLPKKEQR